jgi:hypothetical protein
MSETDFYRSSNIGKVAYLLLKGNNVARLEQDGTKFIFVFWSDAVNDAREYEHDAECSAKQYNESIKRVKKIMSMAKLGDVKAISTDA